MRELLPHIAKIGANRAIQNMLASKHSIQKRQKSYQNYHKAIFQKFGSHKSPLKAGPFPLKAKQEHYRYFHLQCSRFAGRFT
ncbi:hypothetical protein AALA54_13860 [Oscillospiraceae bacterium 44-34]